MTDTRNLQDVAQQLLADGKGLLAADESNSTAGERLAGIGLENTPENRRRYRDLFLSTDGIEEYLSGVILFTETLGQTSDNGQVFPQLLEEKGIIPGVKVDLGTVSLPGFDDEVVTEGLDGLADRLEQYKDSGAKFTKWRAVFKISDCLPTPEAVHVNTITLARYAKIAQTAGYVPIVEPEVLYEGEHSLTEAASVTEEVLSRLCYQLDRFRVDPEATIIKSSMVLPGKQSGEEVDDETIAEATVEVLKEAVAPDIAGVVFLSGGQTSEAATEHLQAIARLDSTDFPMTFSFARALQQPVLEVWQGEDENIPAAREEFLRRLEADALASQGKLTD